MGEQNFIDRNKANPLTRDQRVRVEAMELALKACKTGKKLTFLADYFEHYIKNGAVAMPSDKRKNYPF